LPFVTGEAGVCAAAKETLSAAAATPYNNRSIIFGNGFCVRMLILFSLRLIV
jgi:hypothetical protein